MNYLNRIWLIVLSIFWVINIAISQDALYESKSIFTLLSEESSNEITLTTNIKSLTKSRLKDDPKYQSATLSFVDKNGEKQTWSLEVRARGKMRKSYCSFPPIKFRFTKGDLEQVGLKSKFHTLKLVSHCKKSKKSEQILFKEYLAYKLYNLLTERSYRVHLTTIRYIDSQEKIKPQKHYAFIIENTKEMAKRNKGKRIEPETLNLALFMNQTAAIHDLFQFMIGNSDYKIIGAHNVKLLEIDKHKGIYPVPFDFDYSGFVNADYAVPAEGLAIEDVSQRVFTGFCQPEGVWVQAIQKFQQKRTEIFAQISEFDHLNKNNKKYVEDYISSFYKILDDPAAVQSLIKAFCSLK